MLLCRMTAFDLPVKLWLVCAFTYSHKPAITALTSIRYSTKRRCRSMLASTTDWWQRVCQSTGVVNDGLCRHQLSRAHRSYVFMRRRSAFVYLLQSDLAWPTEVFKGVTGGDVRGELVEGGRLIEDEASSAKVAWTGGWLISICWRAGFRCTWQGPQSWGLKEALL